MSKPSEATPNSTDAYGGDISSYRVAEQIGHILRRASQRHASIFTNRMLDGLTPTRFAALAMLLERGPLSQNALGRFTAMDIATIKGVVDRLAGKGLISINPDPNDGRRHLIALTELGEKLIREAIPIGLEISNQTVEKLSSKERVQLLELLQKIS
ncbi:MAG: MarR family winged helix-turn-helix transcriptional regulator [Hyphomicrobiales bacterium]